MKVRFLFLSVVFCFALASCTNGEEKKDDNNSDQQTEIEEVAEQKDTVVVTTPPVEIPPKKADELFDDFVYAFMHNQKFQHSRIVFPLTNYVEGQDEPIDSKLWKHDPMYSEHELYMTISPNAKVEQMAKDTSINFVLVQEINPVNEAVKQYTFERKKSEWKLTEINHTTVENLEEGSDFMSFYCKFTTDSTFQMAHVSPIIDINVQNDEDEERLEGNISAEQWPQFAPILPKDELMCVRYGKNYASSNKRIVNIDSPSGDAGISMIFEKKDGEWLLVRYKN